jgi:hypothetical protein
MANSSDNKRVERAARLRWIPIDKTRVSPLAQREINQARIDHLAANFDPEELGTPTVNERDGHFYVIDGQHRIEALKQIGWGDQAIQCWTYVGLTEQEEAEKFLKLNDNLTVHAFPRFKVAVTAERPVETDIDRIVRTAGLVVSQDKVPGAIAAVGTLRRVYSRSDAKTLARTLRIARDAYGDAGMEAPVIDGIGHLCARYNGSLNDDEAVKRLGSINGGVNGLLNQAEKIRRQTGIQRGQCVAAAAVEIINRGRGGKKLPGWFKDAQ